MKSVLAVATALLAACAPSGARAADRSSTVVLVVMDSVRADRVAQGGHARVTTPRLDALAALGVVFERAYAGSSSTAQSLSALWTGRLPTSGGSIGPLATPHERLLTLPRLFLRKGFRTGLVSGQTLLRERAFTRGFDEIEIDSASGRWNAELVTAKALDLVDSAGKAPLFLVVDYADAGHPHLPPERFRKAIDVPAVADLLTLDELRAGVGSQDLNDLRASPPFQDLIARYDAEIAWVDECLGKLVDGLAVRGRLADALLIITSSHGTEWLEHGYAGHGWTLFDEVLRVPLVLHAPRYLEPVRVASPVSLADIAPSLCEAFGLELDAASDGRSFMQPEGTRLGLRERSDAVLAELAVPGLCIQRASISTGCKLVVTAQETRPEDRRALLARLPAGELLRADQPLNLWSKPVRRDFYDLAESPLEMRDASLEHPDELARLTELLARYQQKCLESALPPPVISVQGEQPEDGEINLLQQIGYL